MRPALLSIKKNNNVTGGVLWALDYNPEADPEKKPKKSVKKGLQMHFTVV